MSRALATDRLKLFQSGGTIFTDNFTDTDSTALANHVPVPISNGSWKQKGSEDLIITSDKANASGVTTPKSCYPITDMGNKDYTLYLDEMDNSNTGNDFQEIIIRYIDNNNYISLSTSTFLTLGFKLELAKWQNSSRTVIGQIEDSGSNQASDDTGLIGFPITDIVLGNTPTHITVSLVVNGTTYTANLANTEMITSTKVGFYAGATGVTFDGIVVVKN